MKINQFGCGSCGSRNRVAGGGQLVGYAITYRDGTKEEFMSTDLAAVRRKITLKGGGTHRPIVSK